MEPNEPNESPKNLHPMVVLQPGEQVLCQIKRHPIGLMTMYAGAFLVVLVVALLVGVLVPTLTKQDGFTLGQIAPELLLGGGVLLVGMLLMLYVSTSVYWQNQWVITSDSITQITQNGLFGRRVSQLSMENLEDVTVEQTGMLTHMFNYGNLRVETAGERSKFVFQYCPNPTEYARQILDAHEKFEERRERPYEQPAPVPQPTSSNYS